MSVNTGAIRSWSVDAAPALMAILDQDRVCFLVAAGHHGESRNQLTVGLATSLTAACHATLSWALPLSRS